MKNSLHQLILVFGLFLTPLLPAQDFSCSKPLSTNNSAFKKSFELAEKLVQAECNKNNRSYTFQEIETLVKPVIEMAKLELFQQHNYFSSYGSIWLQMFNEEMNRSKPVGVFSLVAIPQRDFIGFKLGSGNNQTTFVETIEDEKAGACLAENCHKTFTQLAGLLNYLRGPFFVKKGSLDGVIGELEILTNKWNHFIEQGRVQTFTDIWLTTWFYNKNKDNDNLLDPPATQYFLLHPTLVFENVNASPDGEQTKEAIGIEVLGFNQWEDSFLGVPFGASIGFVFSDRNGVQDRGEAIFLHFDNAYTLGFSKHGNDKGYFISLDLLKVFSDKQQNYRQWRKQFE
ncbi:hypothetical protein ACUR5C_10110 [Aliikangiella sp. IMCC44653]